MDIVIPAIHITQFWLGFIVGCAAVTVFVFILCVIWSVENQGFGLGR